MGKTTSIHNLDIYPCTGTRSLPRLRPGSRRARPGCCLDGRPGPRPQPRRARLPGPRPTGRQGRSRHPVGPRSPLRRPLERPAPLPSETPVTLTARTDNVPAETPARITIHRPGRRHRRCLRRQDPRQRRAHALDASGSRSLQVHRVRRRPRGQLGHPRGPGLGRDRRGRRPHRRPDPGRLGAHRQRRHHPHRRHRLRRHRPRRRPPPKATSSSSSAAFSSAMLTRRSAPTSRTCPPTRSPPASACRQSSAPAKPTPWPSTPAWRSPSTAACRS